MKWTLVNSVVNDIDEINYIVTVYILTFLWWSVNFENSRLTFSCSFTMPVENKHFLNPTFLVSLDRIR